MKFLKTLSLSMFLFGAITAHAEQAPIKFTGKITQSTYEDMIGKNCSITLTVDEERTKKSTDEKTFFATLKIEGLKPFFHKDKAPKKKMYLFTSTNHHYQAQGGKYKGELSQQLFVKMDVNDSKVLSWSYRDGTREWFGITYVCE